ncbi:hypothetical protein CRN79_16720 [Serratia fonticola]|uniref:hypothetical protein n=1 Tax=Serratia fonticola TaxID=47917 RepID=UPI000BFD8ADE|nr:hypothetical protein [Serratia fonticola]ATM77384.1 hypothetical protein CRN79_16720 [Serratia fonticola]
MAVTKLSKKRDAVCHRDRIKDNKALGFLQKKLFLGDDTLSKLSLLSEQLAGRRLNINDIKGELASDIISACVSHCYNVFFTDETPAQRETLQEYPKVTAGMSPEGLELYRLYQRVKARFDRLNTGDTDKEKWASIAKLLTEKSIQKPSHTIFSEGRWSREDVKWILTPGNISNWIDASNRSYQQEKEKQKLAMKNNPTL